MKKRKGDPWMPADQYGRSLAGLTMNLLVRDVGQALAFHRNVLDASVVYSDEDFAVVEACGAQWMLHTDHTYEDHPFYGSIQGVEARGAGIELRLHGRDPDEAAARAREMDLTVLAGPEDKGHGLREAFIMDADGYVWVPDIHVS